MTFNLLVFAEARIARPERRNTGHRAVIEGSLAPPIKCRE
jgi:hypothetical protein